LYLASRTRGSNGSKRGGTVSQRRSAQVRKVERIGQLAANLELDLFADFEEAEQAEIDIFTAGTTQDVTAQIPVGSGRGTAKAAVLKYSLLMSDRERPELR